MRRSLVAILGLCWAILASPAQADRATSRDEATQALRRATDFFRTQVAAEGGYLWRYSEDLSKREGEGKASETTVWVQPPGTATVGHAYLDAYHATKDEQFYAERDVPHGTVEEHLQQCVSIEQRAFAVCGVPDTRKGERLMVLTTIAAAEVTEVLRRMATRGLPALFVPRADQFVRVDELPMLGTGKRGAKA